MAYDNAAQTFPGSAMSSSETQPDIEQMQRVAADAKELLKAISGPYRLLILCMLLEGEKNVTEICKALDVRQSLVSQHMALLRHMSLVTSERRGHFVYYSIADETTKDIISALHKRYCDLDRDRSNAA